MANQDRQHQNKQSATMMERIGYVFGKYATTKRLALVLTGAIAATIWVVAGRSQASEASHLFPGPGDLSAKFEWGADGDHLGGRPARLVQVMAGERAMQVIVDPADAQAAAEIKAIIAQGVQRERASEREHGMKAPRLDVTDQRSAMEALAAGMGQDGR